MRHLPHLKAEGGESVEDEAVTGSVFFINKNGTFLNCTDQAKLVA